MADYAKAADRFWAKVDQRDPDRCWEWKAARDRDGYGTFWFNGSTGRAPRFSWSLANGSDIPDRIMVRHTCDNPPCVNPAHLILGTSQQNDADRVERGRSATGDRNGARLHPDRILRGPDHPNYLPEGCKNGHPAERRYTAPSGERICTDCSVARTQRYRARKATRA